MKQLETAQRLAGCSFGGGGVPFWGKLKAPIKQLETTQRLAGCSFGVGGVSFWGKLKAPTRQCPVDRWPVAPVQCARRLGRSRMPRRPSCHPN